MFFLVLWTIDLFREPQYNNHYSLILLRMLFMVLLLTLSNIGPTLSTETVPIYTELFTRGHVGYMNM